jgi:sugar transferase (PEP-CTERM/EpsH1 system associated)
LRAGLALAGPTPLTHALLDAPGLAATVTAVVERVRPDVVLAYCSGLAHLTLTDPLQRTPLILDLVDVDSDKWRQYSEQSSFPMSWIYRREARLLGAFEARAARAAAATTVVNQRELESLHAIAPDARGLVVPNGIDVDSFAPTGPPAGAEQVLFCGVMDYRPNDEGARWFLSEVWPRIRSARPGATLVIAGTAPTAALRRLADSSREVHVTGHVEDIRPCYWESAVFVAPLHLARGVQNKVLDAAAAGLPSVVTSAVRGGLPDEIAASCRVADTAESFAAAVIDLLALTPGERRAIAARVDLAGLRWEQRLAPMASLVESAGASPRVDGAED